MFLSNLEIASLVKGTDLDYVIEVKNEVRYMNLNITEKQKKTIVNDLKKNKKIPEQINSPDERSI